MGTLYTFWGTIISYRTESVHFFGGFLNSATLLSLANFLEPAKPTSALSGPGKPTALNPKP